MDFQQVFFLTKDQIYKISFTSKYMKKGPKLLELDYTESLH